MNHTPGPWKAPGDGYARVRDDGKTPLLSLNVWAGNGDKIKHVAEVCIPIHKKWDHIETLANARLISAAPELLEACKALVGDPAIMDLYDTATLGAASRDRVDMARAAIAKAEGR